jgi:hypothetical protein
MRIVITTDAPSAATELAIFWPRDRKPVIGTLPRRIRSFQSQEITDYHHKHDSAAYRHLSDSSRVAFGHVEHELFRRSFYPRLTCRSHKFQALIDLIIVDAHENCRIASTQESTGAGDPRGPETSAANCLK